MPTRLTAVIGITAFTAVLLASNLLSRKSIETANTFTNPTNSQGITYEAAARVEHVDHHRPDTDWTETVTKIEPVPAERLAPYLGIFRLAEQSRTHSQIFERFEAIVSLGDSTDPLAELTLVNLLYDPDYRIREAATESLGVLATAGAIEALRYALGDADERVRLTAIEMLAEVNTRDSIKALSSVLIAGNADVRLYAVTELSDIGSSTALAMLRSFLSDSDPRVRDVVEEHLYGLSDAY